MNHPSNTPDDDLRDLLRGAAADITPRGSLEEIKERTMNENTPRRWVWPTIAAAAAMALVVGGLGWMLREDDGPDAAAPPTGVPTARPSQGATDDPAEVDRVAPVFFVGQTTAGKRLFQDSVRVRTCETARCLMLAAVTTAIDGPAGDPDFATPWAQAPEHTALVVNTDGNEIVIDLEAPADAADPVDLANRPAAMDALSAELAVQQLVHTARAALGQDLPVRFQINHTNTATLLGVPTAEPLTAADPDEIQAPVQITNLGQGQTVPAGTVVVRGMAAAFEANVLWEVRDEAGTVVESGFTTAEECCTLKPYEFSVELGPGTYTIVVHDEDMSGEGRATNEDTKRVVVD